VSKVTHRTATHPAMFDHFPPTAYSLLPIQPLLLYSSYTRPILAKYYLLFEFQQAPTPISSYREREEPLSSPRPL